jgi:anti-sigma factor RsiW
MRCARAQKLMTAALDGELAPRRRRALDRHLIGCEACRRELATTERMLGALEALPMEAAVSAGLEQATLRRVRVAAADEDEGAKASRWRRWLPLPAVAVASVAVLVLAVGIVRRTREVPAPPTVASTPRRPLEEQAARPTAPVEKDTRTARPVPPPVAVPPTEPPPELAAAPEKFVNLPILRNLEKLEHFDAIQTTTLDEEPVTPGGEEQPSNG